MRDPYRVLCIILTACLIASLGFNVFFCFNQNKSVNPLNETYVFWMHNKYIRDGAIQIEVALDWQTENLSMIVTVNDDEYNIGDYLGLVFDQNKNWIIDLLAVDHPYGLLSNNMTWHGGRALLRAGGSLCFAEMPPSPSPFHTCIFDPEVGYTFTISFPKKDLNYVEPPTLIHLCFYDNAKAWEIMKDYLVVVVEFLVTKQ